jgi:hypothetical protein
MSQLPFTVHFPVQARERLQREAARAGCRVADLVQRLVDVAWAVRVGVSEDPALTPVIGPQTAPASWPTAAARPTPVPQVRAAPGIDTAERDRLTARIQELTAEVAALQARPTRGELDRATAEAARLARDLNTARAAHADDTQALRAEITQLTAELTETRRQTVATADLSDLRTGLRGVEARLGELVAQSRAAMNTLITEYQRIVKEAEQLRARQSPPSPPPVPSPPPPPPPPKPAPVAEPVLTELDFVDDRERRLVVGLDRAGNSPATIRAKTGLAFETIEQILARKGRKMGGARG